MIHDYRSWIEELRVGLGASSSNFQFGIHLQRIDLIEDKAPIWMCPFCAERVGLLMKSKMLGVVAAFIFFSSASPVLADLVYFTVSGTVSGYGTSQSAANVANVFGGGPGNNGPVGDAYQVVYALDTSGLSYSSNQTYGFNAILGAIVTINGTSVSVGANLPGLGFFDAFNGSFYDGSHFRRTISPVLVHG
jgi:hypothetical protein